MNFLQGEIVLDLGAGGGIDIFLAASKIGPNGQAIGLDMSSVCAEFSFSLKLNHYSKLFCRI